LTVPFLRHCLLRSLRIALRLRARPLVLAPGTVLVIAPHPDDETLGCGGLILGNPGPVSCLFLTHGEASHRDHPHLTPDALGDQRTREARAAAALLGVPERNVAFLDLPDGRLPHLETNQRQNAVARITAHLDQLQPATVLAAYRRDGSSEHEAAFPLIAAAVAAARRKPRVLEYLVWTAYSPRLLLRFLFSRGRIHRMAFPGFGPAKTRALAAYRSQFTATPPWTEPVQSRDFSNAFSPEEEFFIELPS
jgi:N-acetylglucosamine malate deacetylase 1